MRPVKKTKRDTSSQQQLEELLFGKAAPVVVEQPKLLDLPEQSAWRDAEESLVQVDLTKSSRLRKLSVEKSLQGNVFAQKLQERFQTSALEWADSEFADDSKTSDEILQCSEHLASKASGIYFGGRVNVSRLSDANITEPSRDPISVVRFHHAGSSVVIGGKDKFLRVFKCDGDKNEKQLSVQFRDMPILCGNFVGLSSELIVSGRKPFFYSYDLETGSVNKYSGGNEVKSFERMAMSADGGYVAFGGNGGYAHVFSGKYKTKCFDVKMNCPLRALAFRGDSTLLTSGLDSEVYVWDLRHTARCLQRFSNIDGTCTTSIASSEKFMAIGSESGVLNIYENEGAEPSLIKSVMNLTTTIDSVEFHPSGQFVCSASSEKSDQLRLVHMPSGDVVPNWPGEKTPLRKVQCLSFSPDGTTLAIGSNTGRVLLYRLH